MTKPIEFYFDFASPNAYFVWRVLPEIAERTGAKIEMKPALLGGIFKATNNQAPMMAFGNVQGKLAYEQLEIQRFIKKHQLTEFTFNPHFPVMTILPMRGVFAVLSGGGDIDPYAAACFKAMWEEGKNLSDEEVFVSVLKEGGFDADAILGGTQDPKVKEALKTATEAAVNRGIFGLPTMFVGDEMFFGKERLGQLKEEVVA